MIKTPLQLYKHLDQSNCRRCMLPSCMAFSVAVIQGQKRLKDCPYLSKEKINELSGGIVQKKSMAEEQEVHLDRLRQELSQQGLREIARRLDLLFKNESVGVRCLGKYFWIDGQGEMVSECHHNNWVHIPVLHYLLQSKGRQPIGKWITFSDIEQSGGKEAFFARRCEQEMGRLAEEHTQVFYEILDLFEVEEIQDLQENIDADKSFLLLPLPGVPFLINYWEPEEAFPAKLNILFDTTVSENSNVESIYMLGRGLVEMFEQLIHQHSG
ncbi:MAG: DUF3786 domain-containing protein [Candidatus Electrothrix sp. ATG1]|nr:DUF3786 domain-containing protein [Candidatus Electrothrix sp. ATG1]